MESSLNNIYGKKEDLSDPVLFSRFISGDETAWQIFFESYNPLIDRQIIKTFHLDYYTYNDEDFDHVKNNIIDILLDGQSLSKIDDTGKLAQWLSRVCRNKTHDYVRQKKKVKSSFEEEVRRSTLSLQDFSGRDNDSTIEDMVPDKDGFTGKQESDDLINIRNIINSIEWIYQIVLKLYLIFCDDFLLFKDIDRIATDREVEAETVKKDLGAMLDNLAEKNEKVFLREGETMVVSAYISRLKSRYQFLQEYSERNSEEIGEVEKTITKKEQRLEDLLSENQKAVVPSNREIGTVIGQKDNTVNTRIFRARKLFKDMLAGENAG
jgi:DNA-directed RNA polymerase specialized sigma24 family protein